MSTNRIKSHFEDARSVLDSFLANEANIVAIEQAGTAMVDTIKRGGKIISCGNGGSMSDAMHFAEELSGRFRDDRPALPAVSISDPSHITCVGNDYGFDFIFSRYLQGLGISGDVLLAISTSGNSTNVIEAAKAAKAKDIQVIALTGKSGGELAQLADIEIRAPKSNYADRTQELHIKIIHALIDYIEQHV